jgi:hypothetical protein
MVERERETRTEHENYLLICMFCISSWLIQFISLKASKRSRTKANIVNSRKTGVMEGKEVTDNPKSRKQNWSKRGTKRI